MTRINIRQAKKAAKVTRTLVAPPSVYEDRLTDAAYPDFKAIPHCIFFYYIKKNAGGNYYNVRHYYYPGELDQPLATQAAVKAKVEALVANARIPEENQCPPPIGADWEYPVWDRKSYLAIFIDNPNVALLSPAIEFTQRPATTDTYNYSFFDAWEDTIDGRPVIFCINHMKMDAPGTDLNFAAQYYHFDLNTNPPLRFSIAFPDSGGTNMGPPVPPPS